MILFFSPVGSACACDCTLFFFFFFQRVRVNCDAVETEKDGLGEGRGAYNTHFLCKCLFLCGRCFPNEKSHPASPSIPLQYGLVHYYLYDAHVFCSTAHLHRFLQPQFSITPPTPQKVGNSSLLGSSPENGPHLQTARLSAHCALFLFRISPSHPRSGSRKIPSFSFTQS